MEDINDLPKQKKLTVSVTVVPFYFKQERKREGQKRKGMCTTHPVPVLGKNIYYNKKEKKRKCENIHPSVSSLFSSGC